MTEYKVKSTVVGNLDIVELTYNKFLVTNQKTRKVRIWTPKGYDKNDGKTYPVVYMHDGQNVFDDATAFAGEWGADETMSELMANGFSGAIIVGVDNSSERMGEYIYNHDFVNNTKYENTKSGHLYLDFITAVVKPYVDSNYNTKTDNENTTIAGSSLGGLISLFGGLENLDVFGNIIAFSTSTWAITDSGFKTYLETNDFTNYLNTKFFFYVGTDNDGDVNWPANYKAMLENIGFTNIETKTGQGDGHNEPSWRKHLGAAFKFIFNIS